MALLVWVAFLRRVLIRLVDCRWSIRLVPRCPGGYLRLIVVLQVSLWHLRLILNLIIYEEAIGTAVVHVADEMGFATATATIQTKNRLVLADRYLG